MGQKAADALKASVLKTTVSAFKKDKAAVQNVSALIAKMAYEQVI